MPWKGPAKAPEAVDVRFVVDEGPRTHVAAVDVDGLRGLPAREALEKKVHHELTLGAPFDHGRYLAARNELDAELQHAGYAWAEVDGRVEVDRRSQQAQIRLTADPGPPVHFGEVRVEGAEHIAPRGIRLHAGIAEGARFDPEALEEARGRLFGLGVFSSVRVDYERAQGRPDDRRRHRARPGGQAAASSTSAAASALDFYRTDVHATATYTRRNWLGGLRTLTLRLEPAWVAVPALWDLQRTGPAGSPRRGSRSPIGRCRMESWSWSSATTSASSTPISSMVRARASGSSAASGTTACSSARRTTFSSFSSSTPTRRSSTNRRWRARCSATRTPTASDGFSRTSRSICAIGRSTRTPASTSRATFEEGGIYAGGAFEYEKIVPELRAYAPLGRRLTLAGRLQFGQIFTQSDLASPITRRFYLGGSNSQRGFNYERLSPQVASGIPGDSAIPIGGDQMVLVSAELRLDVVRLFGRWLVVAAFVDGGDVGGPSCGGASSCASAAVPTGVDWGDLHWAAGGGLRYRTVIGSIRADVGVRLNRLSPFEPDGRPNPDPGQRVAFHLSLGEAF